MYTSCFNQKSPKIPLLPHYQKKHVQLGHDSQKNNLFIFSRHLQLVVLTIFLSGLLVLRIATTLCCVGCPKILQFWPNISYWPNPHLLELNVLEKKGETLVNWIKNIKFSFSKAKYFLLAKSTSIGAECSEKKGGNFREAE